MIASKPNIICDHIFHVEMNKDFVYGYIFDLWLYFWEPEI